MSKPIFKYNVIRRVEFEAITEEQLTAMVISQFNAQEPDVVITEVNFARKQGAGIQATVAGHLKGGSREETVVTTTTALEPKETEPVETKVPVEVEVVEQKPEPVEVEEIEEVETPDVDDMLAEEEPVVEETKPKAKLNFKDESEPVADAKPAPKSLEDLFKSK